MIGRRSHRRVLPAAVVLCGLLTAWGSVLAIEGEGFTLSNATPSVKKDYPPIPGQNPSAQVSDPTLSDCNLLPSDVSIPITFEFAREFGHLVQMRVFWEAPEANDVDIYLFDEAGELISSSASSAMPELVQLGSPANGIYYLCVRNFSGPNAGFRVEASTRFLDIGFQTAQPEPTSRPTATPPKATPAPTSTAPVVGAATAEPVRTPGPDGPFSDKRLVSVAGDRQAGPPDDGISGLEIALAALTGVIAVAGASLVVIRIRRDTTAT
ncbi:MAG: hypothetical protein ACRDKJ_12505 [Actinomycetota bacterium]